MLTNDDLNEVYKAFVEESGEELNEMDEALLSLEDSPDDMELINNLFRFLHSIKGNSSTFGFECTSRFAESLEEVLDVARQKQVKVDKKFITLFLRSTDLLRESIEAETTGEPYDYSKCESAVTELEKLKSMGVTFNASEESTDDTSVVSPKIRILIAEDDFNSRKLLKSILSVYGECDLVVNGGEAVEAFMLALSERKPYDLVCLDIMMPVMNGQEALRKIREHEKTRGIKQNKEVVIIMTTAMDTPKEVFKAYYRGGCTDYLVKPVIKSKFIELLKKYRLID